MTAGDQQQQQQPVVVNVPDSRTVTISKPLLASAIDACTRAQRSLQNAQRLSMAAATAFAEEQGAVTEVKQQLESILRGGS